MYNSCNSKSWSFQNNAPANKLGDDNFVFIFMNLALLHHMHACHYFFSILKIIKKPRQLSENLLDKKHDIIFHWPYRYIKHWKRHCFSIWRALKMTLWQAAVTVIQHIEPKKMSHLSELPSQSSTCIQEYLQYTFALVFHCPRAVLLKFLIKVVLFSHNFVPTPYNTVKTCIKEQVD